MVRENNYVTIEVEYETSDEEDESWNDDSVVNYIHLLYFLICRKMWGKMVAFLFAVVFLLQASMEVWLKFIDPQTSWFGKGILSKWPKISGEGELWLWSVPEVHHYNQMSWNCMFTKLFTRLFSEKKHVYKLEWVRFLPLSLARAGRCQSPASGGWSVVGGWW